MDDPGGTVPTDEWLLDAENPALDQAAMARIADPSRPDRLAWNAFRTLALWDSDVWVPALLEIACGPGNPLSPLDWTGTSVQLWASRIETAGATDIVLDGPEGVVLVVATLEPELSLAQARRRYLTSPAGDELAAQARGVVLVGPGQRPETEEQEAESDADGDPVASGWMTWPELARLALDLAEEADPTRAEQVHRLVSQIQSRFPEAGR